MDTLLDLIDRINRVFKLIEDYIDDDNIITEQEFIEIQEIKRAHKITSEQISRFKKKDIDRILYLQLYLLLLDDKIDISERKEIEYYQQIFGYSIDDISTIERRVIEDKDDRKK